MTEVSIGFSSYHLRADDEIHNAAYGARLIYDEVLAGSKGVVYDRQSGWGDKDIVEKEIFPVLDDFYDAIRWIMKNEYQWHGSAETGHFVYRHGLTVVAASPQGSYGYLYMTAVHEKSIEFFDKTVVTNVDVDGKYTPVDFRTDETYLDDKLDGFATDYAWAIKDKNGRFAADTLRKVAAFKAAFHRAPSQQGEQAILLLDRAARLTKTGAA